MNSLNILSTIGASPPPSPSRSRAASEGDIFKAAPRPRSRKGSGDDAGLSDTETLREKGDMVIGQHEGDGGLNEDPRVMTSLDEKSPLLYHPEVESFEEDMISGKWLLPKRISEALIGTLRVVLSALLAPGRYLVACFYNDEGQFSVLMPVRRLSRIFSRKQGRNATRVATAIRDSGYEDGGSRRRNVEHLQPQRSTKRPQSIRPVASPESSSTAVASDSEIDSERPSTRDEDTDTPSRHTRSKSISSNSGTEEISPAKRSIRIKLHNEEALKQRRRKSQARGKPSSPEQNATEAAAAALKSPTSPSTSSKVTKFPRAPQPPRPLIPRRQPSYSASAPLPDAHQKTLIIDLDETLIHSMAKGGRYTTGHMVEVKLRQPVATSGTVLGPQVPILYYVHKRPHCDEFLRKVSKWYKLVVFTASVQEYADPVIDWLELERKYFAERYYRDHCTIRNGAYIKDLARVEPDLSKVMIIDNSPMSYIFHEDNAIPIEGWISDPTDNDLLHLIPLLEGLQYVTDVRAFLTLRLGQPQPV